MEESQAKKNVFLDMFIAMGMFLLPFLWVIFTATILLWIGRGHV